MSLSIDGSCKCIQEYRSWLWRGDAMSHSICLVLPCCMECVQILKAHKAGDGKEKVYEVAQTQA